MRLFVRWFQPWFFFGRWFQTSVWRWWREGKQLHLLLFKYIYGMTAFLCGCSRWSLVRIPVVLVTLQLVCLIDKFIFALNHSLTEKSLSPEFYRPLSGVNLPCAFCAALCTQLCTLWTQKRSRVHKSAHCSGMRSESEPTLWSCLAKQIFSICSEL